MKAAGLVGLAGLLVACSLVVTGVPEELHCSQEGVLGPPACDSGFRCVSGVCRAESDAAELGVGGAEHTSGGAEAEALGGRGSRPAWTAGAAGDAGAGGSGG